MIWSDPMPATAAPRVVASAPARPAVWALDELHAFGSEVFVAPADPAPSAEELQAAADAERQAIAAEAYQSGFEAGRAAALATAREDMGSTIAALQSAVEQITDSEARFVGVLEENLAALAVSVARQLVAREVRTSPEVTVDLIRHAVTE